MAASRAIWGLDRGCRQPFCEHVAERPAPDRVGERFYRLEPEASPRNDPTDAVRNPAPDQAGRRDDRQEAFPSARSYRRQQVADAGSLSRGDGLHDGS